MCYAINAVAVVTITSMILTSRASNSMDTVLLVGLRDACVFGKICRNQEVSNTSKKKVLSTDGAILRFDFYGFFSKSLGPDYF